MYSQLQTSIASSEWSIRWTLLSISKILSVPPSEIALFWKWEGLEPAILKFVWTPVGKWWLSEIFLVIFRISDQVTILSNLTHIMDIIILKIMHTEISLIFLTELLFTESESNRRIKRPREYSKILENFTIFEILIFLAGIHHMGILCLMRAFPNKKNKIWIQEFGLVFTRIGGHKIAVVIWK